MAGWAGRNGKIRMELRWNQRARKILESCLRAFSFAALFTCLLVPDRQKNKQDTCWAEKSYECDVDGERRRVWRGLYRETNSSYTAETITTTTTEMTTADMSLRTTSYTEFLSCHVHQLGANRRPILRPGLRPSPYHSSSSNLESEFWGDLSPLRLGP